MKCESYLEVGCAVDVNHGLLPLVALGTSFSELEDLPAANHAVDTEDADVGTEHVIPEGEAIPRHASGGDHGGQQHCIVRVLMS